MTDLGNKVMESMFDAWCDDRCKEITPDHNDYSHNLDDVVQYICELTGASTEKVNRICVGIEFVNITYDRHEAIKTLAHICPASYHEDL